jgi:hypothetical protein
VVIAMKIFSKHILFILIFTLTLFLSSAVCFAQSGHWVELIPANSGNSPGIRSSEGMAPIGDKKVILFGGSYGERFNDTWIYDLDENKWTKIETDNAPSKRFEHKLVQISKNKVLLFGGWDYEHWLGDTWIFDLEEMKWTDMKPKTSAPAREDFGMAKLNDNNVLVFGGNGVMGTWSHDLWIYDINENTWTELHPKYDYPKGRESIMMTQINENQAFLYGGWGIGILNDNWLFDLNYNVWRSLDFHINKNIIPIADGAMVQIERNKILLFGGDTYTKYCSKDSYYDGTWFFDLNSYTWYELELNIKPPGRMLHGMAKIDEKKVLLYGGFNKNYNHKDDTWLFILDSTTIVKEKNNNTILKIQQTIDEEIYIEYFFQKPSKSIIQVADLQGNKLYEVKKGIQSEGRHSITIPTRNISSGIFFIRFLADDFFKFQKFILVK